MSGKSIFWGVLLGGLVSAWYAATHPDLMRMAGNWLALKVTGTDPNYGFDRFQQEIVDTINYNRRLNKMPPIKVDSDMQLWLKVFAPKLELNNLDDVIKTVQSGQPRYFEVNVSAAKSNTLPELVDKFATVAGKVDPSNGHMGIMVRNQKDHFGYEALLITGHRLENFSPEELTKRETDTFFSICPHCRVPHACKVALNQRGVTLDCKHCGRDYGVLAPDENGRYRYVNEYLTGYEPPAHYPEDNTRLQTMFTIWNSVVSHCLYTKDTTDASPNRDAWQTPLETMVRGRGDCEDSALLLTDWLIARGFEARVALGRYGDLGQHAWCVVRVDGMDYLLESTEGQPNIDKLPYAQEVGGRYMPEVLFDRSNIYVRANPRDRFDGNYWSAKSWLRVQPRHLFDDASNAMDTLAMGVKSQSNIGQANAPRVIATSTRPKKSSNGFDPMRVPMPTFTRLADLAPNLDRWQFIVPLTPP